MEKEQIKLGKTILNEDELKHEVEVFGVTFHLKLPSPDDRSNIEIAVAQRLNGMSRNSFPADFVVESTVRATLDVIVEKCSDPDFDSWKSWDKELLYKVFNEYRGLEDNLLKSVQR